jgi:transcriptional regulator with XRE-family HTH domain
MSIGTEIKRLRTERGWSQARLGREAELSTSYLFYLENDQVLPSAEKLRHVIRTLGGDPEPLVRVRDEIELRRLEVDAPTVLRLKEEFGDLTDEEREAVVDLVRGVRTKSKGRSAGKEGRGAARRARG